MSKKKSKLNSFTEDRIEHDGEEIERVKQQLVRTLADYDNLVKRVEKERSELESYANAGFVKNLLPVIDMFEQVQVHLKDSGLAIAMGELYGKLREAGVEEVRPVAGDEFSEETMEAVDVVDGGRYKDGEVVELSLKGWRMRDKILRWAKVTVAKKGENKNE